METTLFWIGCGLGGYAYVLRQIFKREELLGRRALISALHVIFIAAVGGLIGFVFSASIDLHGPSPVWPMRGAIAGFLWGIIQVWRGRDNQEGTTSLLAGDLEWVETSFSAILLAAVIMYAVVQAFKIPSGSMEDTLQIGDHLFVNKFIYGIRVPFTTHRVLKLRDVHHQEIIVFEAPESAIISREEREHNVHKDFIKRAVGLGGDVIQIKNKHLFVNGVPQDEPYAIYRDPMVYPAEHLALAPEDYQRVWESGKFSQLRREEIGDNFGPVKVPPGYYFAMGDNRDGSFDFAFLGAASQSFIERKSLDRVLAVESAQGHPMIPPPLSASTRQTDGECRGDRIKWIGESRTVRSPRRRGRASSGQKEVVG